MEKEVPYEEAPRIYAIPPFEISNRDREVGNNLAPWRDKILEPGISTLIDQDLETDVAQQTSFEMGLLKVLLALSREAARWYEENQKPHFAAGILTMIHHYLEPFYREGVDEQESHYLAIDAIKEALRITEEVDFSDTPVTLQAIHDLSDYLQRLIFEALPLGYLALKTDFQDAISKRRWLDFHSATLLTDIQKDIGAVS